jgi:hypothetical protein
MDNLPVRYGDRHVSPRVVGDQVARNDDLAIRARMDGLSYSQMAARLHLSSAGLALDRYRAARARQIPSEHLPRPLPKPSGFVIAWAAGFFDGEGCVFGYEDIQRGYRRFSFGVVVSQVVRDPLEELMRAWGGTIHVKPAVGRARSQFSWGIRGRAAAHFLSDIAPYLRVKRPAAEAAIPVLFNVHSKGVAYSDAELLLRRGAVAALHDLNGGKGMAGRGPARMSAKEVAE